MSGRIALTAVLITVACLLVLSLSVGKSQQAKPTASSTAVPNTTSKPQEPLDAISASLPSPPSPLPSSPPSTPAPVPSAKDERETVTPPNVNESAPDGFGFTSKVSIKPEYLKMRPSLPPARQRPVPTSTSKKGLLTAALKALGLSPEEATPAVLCNLTAGLGSLDLWRTQQVRVVHGSSVQDTYAFPWHEYTPTLVECFNCAYSSIFEREQVFPKSGDSISPKQLNRESTISDTRVVFRVGRYMPFYGNPYESFHTIVDTVIAMKFFDLKPNQIQVVLIDPWNMSSSDDFLWRVMSDMPPQLMVKHNADLDVLHQYPRVVSINTHTVTSLLCTKDAFGVYRGRGKSHSCRSPLFVETVEVIRAKALQELTNNEQPPETPPPAKDNVLKVIWVSRRGKVGRRLYQEEEFLATLQSHLDKACSNIRFNLTALDFAAIDIRETIAAVSSANALVGVHGAGLMFSSFLSSKQVLDRPHPALLIEIFGKDRLHGNRHYENVMSLMPPETVRYAWTQVQRTATWNETIAASPFFVQWGHQLVGDVVNRLSQHFCRK